MTPVYTITAAILVGILLIGLVRVALGPTQPDRMLAASLFATSGVALLLLLAELESEPAVVDVALVLAVLAVVAVVAFVRRLRPSVDRVE